MLFPNASRTACGGARFFVNVVTKYGVSSNKAAFFQCSSVIFKSVCFVVAVCPSLLSFILFLPSGEDINKILESSLVQLEIPSNHHIQFVKEYDDVVPTKVNAKKINKAFLALISNAVLAVEANAKIILRTTQLKSHIRIDIIDNGCGIPEDALTTVFNPFYTTRKIGEGVGLGLHMAQNTAESHDGALNVSSKVGEGTILTMILPIKSCEMNASDWPMDTQLSL